MKTVQEELARAPASAFDRPDGWLDGLPPSGVDLAWLRIEEPDGDGGCDVRARLAGFDGEWWCECADARGEWLGEYVNGNIIGWQPPLVPEP